MTDYWLTVMTTLASIATGLVGFAGLLTAFRSSGAPLSLSDITYIRILLIFALGALIFAVLPMLTVGEGDDWRPPTVLIAIFLLFWPLNVPSWNKRRGVKPRRPALYWTVLAAMFILSAALLWVGLAGRSTAGLYALAVSFCLLVALMSFVSQVFALLPVDPKR